MVTLLESLDTLQVEIGRSRLFDPGEDGPRARNYLARVPGYPYERRLAEAAAAWADVLEGRKSVAWLLNEALTTSDFPLLTADILDRSMLAQYREWIPTWPAYARRRTVRDFRTVKMFPPAYGADLRLEEVDEQDQYPEATLTEQAAVTLSVKKYGRRLSFSWEAIVNDDMQQLMDIPGRFARAARRTESRAAVDLFVDASGPHASLYTAGNKNIINVANGASANNPPLSISGLQDGFKVLANIKDEQGEPIFIDAVTLVVPPALEVTARNILNAIQLELTTAGGVRDGGSGEQRLIAQNWMRNRLTLVVDPYLPMVATTANGNTSWFLFANPNDGRPALMLAFLQGHEEPEIFIKSPNAMRVGGGMANPMDGDFENDSVTYKVRHVLGGGRIDPRATVASNGSGS